MAQTDHSTSSSSSSSLSSSRGVTSWVTSSTTMDYQSIHLMYTSVTLRSKLHYTDTGYGHVVQHRQRTSSQQFYNLLYNKFTNNRQQFATSQCQSPTSRYVQMLGCSKFVANTGNRTHDSLIACLTPITVTQPSHLKLCVSFCCYCFSANKSLCVFVCVCFILLFFYFEMDKNAFAGRLPPGPGKRD